MSSKNKAIAPQTATQPSPFNPLRPRSLRLRLVLWYGLLITIALTGFAVLVLSFTTNALNQSVESSVRTEAHAVSVEVNSELLSVPPYWPKNLVLRSPDTYQDAGIVVEVIDAQGIVRYDSDSTSAARIPSNTAVAQAVREGHTYEYNDRYDGQPVRIEALPVRISQQQSTGSNGATTSNPGNNITATPSTTSSVQEPVIGTILVAHTLSNTSATLTLLQSLLLLIGGVTLIVTLLGGWAIATRVLHPLAEIATTAHTIAATTARGTRIGNLSQRVKSTDGHDEMAQVVDAFNDMLSDLQKATQGQRRFIADASHELRAPLTTIQGNLAFLQQHGDMLPSEERQTMLNDAYNEVLSLAALVEDLLLLARADANADTSLFSHSRETQGKKTYIVELDRVALQLVRQLRGRLNAEENAPVLEIGSIEPVHIQSDEESIRRILLILLDNAIKYTAAQKESGKGCITVSVERREQEAIIVVSDDGIGIEADALEHIFERFYRADLARSRQGTGLGLAIAKTLTEQLGGHIAAESIPGKGSTFNLFLPL
ncbi:MAG TPA: hypothetical protein DHW02_23000 [Ktedonobacter sp.]|nr:hypothetical protein [Ktedonobacter sp.]